MVTLLDFFSYFFNRYTINWDGFEPENNTDTIVHQGVTTTGNPEQDDITGNPDVTEDIGNPNRMKASENVANLNRMEALENSSDNLDDVEVLETADNPDHAEDIAILGEAVKIKCQKAPELSDIRFLLESLGALIQGWWYVQVLSLLACTCSL